MKRNLLGFIAVLMALALCACSAKDDVVINKGTVADEVYSCGFGNLTFTAPENWYFYTTDKINGMLNIAADTMSTDEIDIKKLLENQTTVYDMMCQDLWTGASTLVMYENLANYGYKAKTYTEEKYADGLLAASESMNNISYKEISRKTKTLGGIEFLAVEHEITVSALGMTNTSSQRYYLKKTGDYMICICNTAGNTDYSLDDIEKFFGAK